MATAASFRLDQATAFQKFQFYSGIMYANDLKKLEGDWQAGIAAFRNSDVGPTDLKGRLTTVQQQVFENPQFLVLRDQNLYWVLAGICALVQRVVFWALGIADKVVALRGRVEGFLAPVKLATISFNHWDQQDLMCRRSRGEDPRRFELYLEGQYVYPTAGSKIVPMVQLWISQKEESVGDDRRRVYSRVLTWKFSTATDVVEEKEHQLLLAIEQLFKNDDWVKEMTFIPKHPNPANESDTTFLEWLFPKDGRTKNPAQSVVWSNKDQITPLDGYQVTNRLSVFNQLS